ncbi:biotin/lipoyl-containing protein [Stomatohabitans albus]|uniref:biotin/lipoyl-containing protein n=1 Tax=Stomatohabitans albus TaxID=3110766 RepID=UPI00300D5D0D
MAALVIRLPAITTEMDTGRLLRWIVSVGDEVTEGDPICEFTTDKVDTELESPYTGTVMQLLIPEGGAAQVGDGIAIVEGNAPDLLGDLDPVPSTSTPLRSDEQPDEVSRAVSTSTSTEDQNPVAAPRAVRLEAERRGIDLATITPTGSRGQITMADLDAVADQPTDEATHHPTTLGAPDTQASQPPSAVTQRPSERRHPSGQRSSGRRRHRREQSEPSPITVPVQPPEPIVQSLPMPIPVEPPCTLFTHIDVTDVMDEDTDGLALLARVAWAYGQALWLQPDANAIWDSHSQLAERVDTVVIDVGMETAEATMETAPIAVPIDATRTDVMTAVTQGYDRIRAGNSPDGIAVQRSASLVDLGLWGIERFTPTLQPPQATALGMGAVQTVPSLVGRTVTIRQLLTLALTVDTRVLDPVQAATLLATIGEQIRGFDEA